MNHAAFLRLLLLVTVPALALLAPPATAQVIADQDLGARVVFRTPPPPTPPSVRVEAVTEQNQYPYAFESVYLRFGFSLTAATIHLGIPAVGPTVDGVTRWARTIQNLAATDTPEVVILSFDVLGGSVGRALACTQETERRLVCRGGPQP